MSQFSFPPDAAAFDFLVEDEDRATIAVNRESETDITSASWHLGLEEGQLAVDVLETKKDIIVISTMAGATPGQFSVTIHNELLTIRGERSMPPSSTGEAVYIHQECFWGKFSRTIVLPVEVKADLARAEYKHGVLVITMPKRTSRAEVPIKIVDE